MEEIIYQNYEEYKKTVERVLNKTVEDFVTIGYLLKKGRDTDILKESGYANVNEFADAEYHLDASQVSRFIRINDKFAVDGYSDRLKPEYQGYGYAKLAIMLTLPDELNEELSPDMSKKEIQAVKEEVELEGKVTDIEVLLEGDRDEQKELSNLAKGMHQLFEDEPALFKEVYEAMEGAPGLRTLKEILVPSGEKVYSVRIQGIGRIMLIMNDNEDQITVYKVRSNEKTFHSWEEVKAYIESLLSDRPARERWEELFGREFPENAPVQPGKPKARKESKVKKAKVPEKKEKQKKKENAPVQPKEDPLPEKPKEEHLQERPGNAKEAAGLLETEPEPPEEPNKNMNMAAGGPDQVEGQTNLMKDFPEYCPEAIVSTAGQEVQPRYGSRKEYMDRLTIEEAAEYMAEAMRTLPRFRMNFKDFWERWLSEEVDEAGKKVEVVS